MVVNKTYSFFVRHRIHHVLLWLVYLAFWLFVYQPGDNVVQMVNNSIIIVVTHFIASYVNIYILFPHILRNRYYAYYVIALILLVLFSSYLQAFLFYLMNSGWGNNQVQFFTFNFFLNAGMSTFLAVAVTMSLKITKQWYERDQLAKKLERINVETELRYLKSQINPHFLFNTLNSLYALTIKKSDDAPEMVLKLSEIMRYVLYDSSEKLVPLQKELNYLQNYLDLEKLRLGDRLQLKMEVTGADTDWQVPPLLFLTFVENSFKHGVAQSAKGGYVSIHIDTSERKLNFEIANSKQELVQNKKDKNNSGIGLTNVKKRLEILFPDKYELELKDFPQEYKVNLFIFRE